MAYTVSHCKIKPEGRYESAKAKLNLIYEARDSMAGILKMGVSLSQG